MSEQPRPRICEWPHCACLLPPGQRSSWSPGAGLGRRPLLRRVSAAMVLGAPQGMQVSLPNIYAALVDGAQWWRHADYPFGLVSAVTVVMDRFEVDFEADFFGAQLSAVVEELAIGEAPVLTFEGSFGGEDGPLIPRMVSCPARARECPAGWRRGTRRSIEVGQSALPGGAPALVCSAVSARARRPRRPWLASRTGVLTVVAELPSAGSMACGQGGRRVPRQRHARNSCGGGSPCLARHGDPGPQRGQHQGRL